jgi:fructose-1,6-bisphosphatase
LRTLISGVDTLLQSNNAFASASARPFDTASAVEVTIGSGTIIAIVTDSSGGDTVDTSTEMIETLCAGNSKNVAIVVVHAVRALSSNSATVIANDTV